MAKPPAANDIVAAGVSPVVHAVLRYGDYLVDVTASDPTKRPNFDHLRDVVARAFDVQIRLVVQAQQLGDDVLPRKGSRPASDDQDNIRSLVTSDSTMPASVYGPRAVAYFSTVGDVLLQALPDNGATHNADARRCRLHCPEPCWCREHRRNLDRCSGAARMAKGGFPTGASRRQVPRA